MPLTGQKGGKKPASRSCVIPPIAVSRCFVGMDAGADLATGTNCPCPRRRRTLPRPNKSTCVAGKEGAADCPAPFLRRSGRQSPALTGAQVFALFPRGLEPSSFQRLVIPSDRPPPVQPVTGNACPLLLVDSCAVHVSTDTEVGEAKFEYRKGIQEYRSNMVIKCLARREFENGII